MDVLEVSQDQILSYLDENSIGFGSYMQQPPTKDISRCILAFLLSWQINLRQFHESEAGYRASFANFIRKRNLTGPMMKILFSILPYDKGNLLSADPVVVDGTSQCFDMFYFTISFHLYQIDLYFLSTLNFEYYSFLDVFYPLCKSRQISNKSNIKQFVMLKCT